MKALLLVLLLFLTGCDQKTEPKKIAATRPVRTMIIPTMQKTALRNFPAKAIASKEVTLSFRVTGKLEKLPIEEGMLVKKDQLIGVLDPKQFEDKVKEEHARYILAKAQFERGAKLVKNGHISRAEYDRLKSQHDQTLASLQKGQRNLSYTKLMAPEVSEKIKAYLTQQYPNSEPKI